MQVAAEIEPVPNRASELALALQRLGFKVLHIGATISIQGAPDLWRAVFSAEFEEVERKALDLPGSETRYLKVKEGTVRIPPDLQPLLSSVSIAVPPDLH
jgi:hypothetical protein